MKVFNISKTKILLMAMYAFYSYAQENSQERIYFKDIMDHTYSRLEELVCKALDKQLTEKEREEFKNYSGEEIYGSMKRIIKIRSSSDKIADFVRNPDQHICYQERYRLIQQPEESEFPVVGRTQFAKLLRQLINAELKK